MFEFAEAVRLLLKNMSYKFCCMNGFKRPM